MSASSVDILYEDADLVVINKPAGIFVHRTALARPDEPFLLQQLRNALGRHLYPVHRLDRPTSGVLVFATNSLIAQSLGLQFSTRTIKKDYLAIVRGWTEDAGLIDYPLTVEKNANPLEKRREAKTSFYTLARAVIPVAIEKYSEARYSLLRVHPESGRRHQIRRHLKHIHHPIIGDTQYGRGEHNRYFREKFAVTALLLHAEKLQFLHPVKLCPLTIVAPLPSGFRRIIFCLGWSESIIFR